MPDFGAYQNEIYLAGASGHPPSFPMRFDELEAKAHAAMPASLVSYVAGGRGDERTQEANVAAFDEWGLWPRIVRRRQAARLVNRAFRHAAAVALVHESDRCHRALRPGRPWRSGDRTRRRADRRAHGRLDAVGRFARGGRRRVQNDAGILPALHSNRPRAGGKPCGARRAGRFQGDRRDARHLGGRMAPAISPLPTSRNCAAIA